MLLTLDGTRRWNRRVSFVVHLRGVIRSESRFWRTRKGVDPAVPISEFPGDAGTWDALLLGIEDPAPTPERAFEGAALIARIRDSLSNDALATAIFSGLTEGRTTAELTARLGVSRRVIETVKQRVQELRRGWHVPVRQGSHL